VRTAPSRDQHPAAETKILLRLRAEAITQQREKCDASIGRCRSAPAAIGDKDALRPGPRDECVATKPATASRRPSNARAPCTCSGIESRKNEISPAHDRSAVRLIGAAEQSNTGSPARQIEILRRPGAPAVAMWPTGLRVTAPRVVRQYVLESQTGSGPASCSCNWLKCPPPQYCLARLFSE